MLPLSLCAALSALSSAALPSAHAAEPGPVDLGVLKQSDIRVVQRRLYSQEDRLELGAHLGLLPFEDILFTPQLLLSGGWHLSESAAVEARIGGGYGLLTNYYDAMEQAGVVPEAYRYLGGVDVSFQWTPVYGKISLAGKRIVHTDLYLSLGGGVQLEQSIIPSDNKADGDGDDPATFPTIVAPAIPLAIGSHLFLSQSTALRFELRDTMLVEKRVQTGTTWFRQSLGVSAGFVFYGKAKN